MTAKRYTRTYISSGGAGAPSHTADLGAVALGMPTVAMTEISGLANAQISESLAMPTVAMSEQQTRTLDLSGLALGMPTVALTANEIKQANLSGLALAMPTAALSATVIQPQGNQYPPPPAPNQYATAGAKKRGKSPHQVVRGSAEDLELVRQVQEKYEAIEKKRAADPKPVEVPKIVAKVPPKPAPKPLPPPWVQRTLSDRLPMTAVRASAPNTPAPPSQDEVRKRNARIMAKVAAKLL